MYDSYYINLPRWMMSITIRSQKTRRIVCLESALALFVSNNYSNEQTLIKEAYMRVHALVCIKGGQQTNHFHALKKACKTVLIG